MKYCILINIKLFKKNRAQIAKIDHFKQESSKNGSSYRNTILYKKLNLTLEESDLSYLYLWDVHKQTLSRTVVITSQLSIYAR